MQQGLLEDLWMNTAPRKGSLGGVCDKVLHERQLEWDGRNTWMINDKTDGEEDELGLLP